MTRSFSIAAYLLSCSTACAYDAPLYAWKFEKFYGMCLISVQSVGEKYKLSISSIGPNATDTTLFWKPEVVQDWDSYQRYDVTLLFDNELKSSTTGVLSDNWPDGNERLTIGGGYNLEAFGQHDLLELYVDGRYVAAFPLPGASAAIRSWVSCTIEEK